MLLRHTGGIMTTERKLSDKEVSEIISEIRNIRTAKTVQVTAKGALYVRPIDIIVSGNDRDTTPSPSKTSNGNGHR
jgi:hypothetical protein